MMVYTQQKDDLNQKPKRIFVFSKLVIYSVLGIFFYPLPLLASDIGDEENFHFVSYKKKKNLCQKRLHKKESLSKATKQKRTALVLSEKQALEKKIASPVQEIASSVQQLSYDPGILGEEDLKNIFFLVQNPHSKKEIIFMDWEKYTKDSVAPSRNIEMTLLEAVKEFVKKPSQPQKRKLFTGINQYLHQNHFIPRTEALYAMTLKLGLGVMPSSDRALKFAKQAHRRGEAWLSCFFTQDLGMLPKKPGLGGSSKKPGLGGSSKKPGLGGSSKKPGLGGSSKKPGLGTSPKKPGLGESLKKPDLGTLPKKSEEKDIWGGYCLFLQKENEKDKRSNTLKEYTEDEEGNFDQNDFLDIIKEIL